MRKPILPPASVTLSASLIMLLSGCMHIQELNCVRDIDTGILVCSGSGTVPDIGDLRTVNGTTADYITR